MRLSSRKVWFAVMVLLYIVAGTMHFIQPEFYSALMPVWLPLHEDCNVIAGIAEIAFALLLIIPRYQSLAAWLISIMLLIFMVVIHIPLIFRYTGLNDWYWWINLARIPVQYFLIRWALNYVGSRPVRLFDKEES